MKCYDEWDKSYDNGGIWKWNYPAKFLSNVVPQFNKNIKLFFQISDDNIDIKNDDDSKTISFSSKYLYLNNEYFFLILINFCLLI